MKYVAIILSCVLLSGCLTLFKIPKPDPVPSITMSETVDTTTVIAIKTDSVGRAEARYRDSLITEQEAYSPPEPTVIYLTDTTVDWQSMYLKLEADYSDVKSQYGQLLSLVKSLKNTKPIIDTVYSEKRIPIYRTREVQMGHDLKNEAISAVVIYLIGFLSSKFGGRRSKPPNSPTTNVQA